MRLVNPGMLQSPSVLKWLGGIEPAWALLDFASFNALRHDPVTAGGPIRLANDLVREHVEQSAVVRNTRILLEAALIGPGLKMTATGNLSRNVVAHFVDAFIWPDFEKTYTFRFHKVINEPDFLPLFFTRHVAQGAKLRKRKLIPIFPGFADIAENVACVWLRRCGDGRVLIRGA